MGWLERTKIRLKSAGYRSRFPQPENETHAAIKSARIEATRKAQEHPGTETTPQRLNPPRVTIRHHILATFFSVTASLSPSTPSVYAHRGSPLKSREHTRTRERQLWRVILITPCARRLPAVFERAKRLENLAFAVFAVFARTPSQRLET